MAALVLLAAAFVLWGIGSALRRLAGARRGRWSVSIGVGLAAVVCAGGILNLAHIAYRPALWLLIVAATGIALIEARKTRLSLADVWPQAAAARVELALSAIIVAAVVLFAVATQLPPRELNFQDDLQKYLVHPVRMLETGTLAGSPLSALGSETLGGQAFLHAFVLSVLPIPYVNGVDAVFGLFLLMLLAAAAGWRRFGWFPGAALGAALIGIINPLYANVSGLYTGAVFIAVAVLLVADEREDASPVLLGLVYAALVAIKPTFGLFAAFHFPFAILAARVESGTWKRALAWAAKVALWGAVGVAAWFAVYLPTYFSHGDLTAGAAFNSKDLSDVSLFSTVRLFNGDSIASYTAVAGVAAFVVALALIALARGPKAAKTGRPYGLLAGAMSGVACFLALILYFSLWIGYQTCVRYSVPFLLGSCVIAALMAPSLFPAMPRAASVTLPAFACMAVIACFLPAVPARFEQAVNYGSILEFAPSAESPVYQRYMQTSLSSETRQQIQKLQSAVPQGEPILAWIDTPYFLNYGRNPIVDVDMAGTSTRWAGIPLKVHYFLWQYQGLGVRGMGDYAQRATRDGIGRRDRQIAARSLEFANRITELANHSEAIAQLNTGDDRYVLFHVDDLASAQKN